MPIPLIGLAVTAGLGTYQAIHAAQQEKKAKAAAAASMAARPTFQTSPAALLANADAQSRINAVNPAVTAGYGAAQQAEANRIGAAQHYASSGAEALAAGSSAQNQFYNALPGLIGAQSDYQQGNLKNYYGTLQGLTQQDELKAQDANAAYGDSLNYNLGLQTAANQNLGQGLGMIGSSIGGLASLGGQYKMGSLGSSPLMNGYKYGSTSYPAGWYHG